MWVWRQKTRQHQKEKKIRIKKKGIKIYFCKWLVHLSYLRASVCNFGIFCLHIGRMVVYFVGKVSAYTRLGIISTVSATSYRFESVWLHFFLPRLSFLIQTIFFFVYPSVSTFGKHYNFLVSISIYPLFLSFPLSLSLSLFWKKKHFPHFCLRISLMCVGGCLVCVLIFFLSITSSSSRYLLLLIFFS